MDARSWRRRPRSEASAPESGQGNVVGLALVVGLFAFFLADALPGGLNAVAAFFLAAGIVLLVFLTLLVTALLISRIKQPRQSTAARGATIHVGGAVVGNIATGAHSSVHAGATAVPGAAAGGAIPRREGLRTDFLRRVDELSAAIDTLPEQEVREVEADLDAFVSADPGERAAVLERVQESWGAVRLSYEIRRFVEVAAVGVSQRELDHLSEVLRGRRTQQ